MTKNTIMPIERAFDEYHGILRVYAPDEPPNVRVLRRWVMRDFRTSVPARSLSEITTQQVNDWITEQARRGPENSEDYQYANLPSGGNVQIFQRYGRGDA